MEITAADTLELITEYGVDAVFHTGTAAFDPTTSAVTVTGAATVTVKVVEEERQDKLPADAACLVYFSPSGVTLTPTVGQTVDYKGNTWTVTSCKPVSYKSTVLLYAIGLKGAAP